MLDERGFKMCRKQLEAVLWAEGFEGRRLACVILLTL